jgi:hypothetical protein
MDGVVEGTRGLPVSACCCIPLKHSAVHVNLSNALSASDGYHVVITTNRAISLRRGGRTMGLLPVTSAQFRNSLFSNFIFRCLQFLLFHR